LILIEPPPQLTAEAVSWKAPKPIKEKTP